MKLPPSSKRLLGFTLIELLIVVSIIVILAGFGFVSFTRAQMNARDARRANDLNQVKSALQFYFEDFLVYPWSDGGGGNIVCTPPRSLVWGVDPFCGTTGEYLKLLPSDPLRPTNLQFCYISVPGLPPGPGGTFFTLYASMEVDGNGNIDPPEPCGAGVYNYKLEVSN